MMIGFTQPRRAIDQSPQSQASSSRVPLHADQQQQEQKHVEDDDDDEDDDEEYDDDDEHDDDDGIHDHPVIQIGAADDDDEDDDDEENPSSQNNKNNNKNNTNPKTFERQTSIPEGHCHTAPSTPNDHHHHKHHQAPATATAASTASHHPTYQRANSLPVSSSTPLARTSPPVQQRRKLECDYDQSPTPLYLAIEAKQWDAVLEMLENDDDDDDDDSGPEEFRSGKHTTSKSSKKTSSRGYPLSHQQQAACWVVRKEQDGRLRWRLLPIHASIIFDAPATVVEALLEAFPAAASQKDDQGMLPLHLVFRNITLNSEDKKKGALALQTSTTTAVNWLIVEELLTAYPAAIFSRDRKGRTPLQGGMFAAQQTLNKNRTNGATGTPNGNGGTPTTSSSSKSNSQNNKQTLTPNSNHHKMAALRVLELYTNIAIAGEKTVWSNAQKQKTNQRLAALSEQHAYRLQEIRQEFELEQQLQRDAQACQMDSLLKQIQTLQATNTKLRTELLEYQKQQQHPTSKMTTNVQQHEEYHALAEQMHEVQDQNTKLKRQVQHLTIACRAIALGLQQTAAEHEIQLSRTAHVATATTKTTTTLPPKVITTNYPGTITITTNERTGGETLDPNNNERNVDSDVANTSCHEGDVPILRMESGSNNDSDVVSSPKDADNSIKVHSSGEKSDVIADEHNSNKEEDVHTLMGSKDSTFNEDKIKGSRRRSITFEKRDEKKEEVYVQKNDPELSPNTTISMDERDRMPHPCDMGIGAVVFPGACSTENFFMTTLQKSESVSSEPTPTAPMLEQEHHIAKDHRNRADQRHVHRRSTIDNSTTTAKTNTEKSDNTSSLPSIHQLNQALQPQMVAVAMTASSRCSTNNSANSTRSLFDEEED